VGIINGALACTPLDVVVKGKKPLDPWFLKAADIMAH
jgi:hypothetical protein